MARVDAGAARIFLLGFPPRVSALLTPLVISQTNCDSCRTPPFPATLATRQREWMRRPLGSEPEIQGLATIGPATGGGWRLVEWGAQAPPGGGLPSPIGAFRRSSVKAAELLQRQVQGRVAANIQKIGLLLAPALLFGACKPGPGTYETA